MTPRLQVPITVTRHQLTALEAAIKMWSYYDGNYKDVPMKQVRDHLIDLKNRLERFAIIKEEKP